MLSKNILTISNMIGKIQGSRNGKNSLILIKAIYKNLTAHIILKGDRLDTFPLRSETRQEYHISALLFNSELEFLSNAKKQEK